jgi:hypothetical protein
MQRKSVVGVFCEDIRAEKSGAFTLIGIMPDNANVSLPDPPQPNQRGVMPKLCLYIRINVDAADTVKNISTKVRLPDGNEIDLGTVAQNIIEMAFADATNKGNPLAIVVLRAEFLGFLITGLGRIIAEVTVEDEVFIAAQLNLTTDPETKESEIVEDVRRYTQMIKVQPISPTS